MPNFFEAETTYTMKVRAELQYIESKWSREAKFTSPRFSECCIWKECHNHANLEMKYSVDEKNPRVVTKAGEGGYSTIIGNTSLPLNKVTSWSIKILKSRENDGL